MLEFVPLQALDNFLLDYNVGQALLLAFGLAVVGVLPLKSMRLLSLNLVLFGLVFALLPTSLAPMHYTFLGIALLVVAPMLYVFAER